MWRYLEFRCYVVIGAATPRCLQTLSIQTRIVRANSALLSFAGTCGSASTPPLNRSPRGTRRIRCLQRSVFPTFRFSPLATRFSARRSHRLLSDRRRRQRRRPPPVDLGHVLGYARKSAGRRHRRGRLRSLLSVGIGPRPAFRAERRWVSLIHCMAARDGWSGAPEPEGHRLL